MSIFKHDEPKTVATGHIEPSKYFQLIARCTNCRKEAPIYFEFGKRIEWKSIKKVCGVCGIDAGWVASE
jgi:hypothetical protein